MTSGLNSSAAIEKPSPHGLEKVPSKKRFHIFDWAVKIDPYPSLAQSGGTGQGLGSIWGNLADIPRTISPVFDVGVGAAVQGNASADE